MKRILAIGTAFALMTGAAIAQTTPSTTDKPAPSGAAGTTDPKQSSPGATGAMQNETGGVATSPQEVQKQGGAATAPGHQGDKSTSTTGGAGGEKPK